MTKEFEFNYDQDTAIDPDNMLEEFLTLSSTFFQYSKALFKAEREVKRLWEVTKTTRAKLVAEAKEKTGAKNDAEREAYFRPHPDYIAARQAQIDAEYERDMIQAALNAFYRKEKGLEGASGILLKIEYWNMPDHKDIEVPKGKRIVDVLRQAAANGRRAATARRKTRTETPKTTSTQARRRRRS
jgi:hypothetical protein